MSIGLSLGPRSVERPADVGFTAVGVLDSDSPARVDGAGLVQLASVDWSLDWWIGADDRWYLPAREATIRQSRLSSGPILETAMRIPSGDAKQRVYAATVRGQQVIVVEVENDSPVPVALGLAIRPYGLAGEYKELSISLDDEILWVEGLTGEGKTTTRSAIRLPRPPNEFGVSPVDVLDTVISGGSLGGGHDGAARIVGGSTGVALYPLPHRTTLRFVIADSVVAADSVPGPDDVAKGWQQILDRGGRFSFPDPGLTQQAGVARSRLLGASPRLPNQVAVLAPGAGKLLEGLALSGAAGEVREPLTVLSRSFFINLPGSPREAAAIMAAVGRAASLVDDADLLEGLLEPMAQITQLVERSGDSVATAEAFEGLANLLLVADQPEPAQDLFARAKSVLALADPAEAGSGISMSSPGASTEDGHRALTELTTLAEEASPSGSWGDDSVDKAADFWIAARSLLIDDQLNLSDSRSLRLLPAFPHAWKGGDVEVHGAHIRFGRLSFGIRWHGYRPALLWDLESEQPVTITCPGLDPDWSTTEHRGETLLIGSAEDLPKVPVEGESFQ